MFLLSCLILVRLIDDNGKLFHVLPILLLDPNAPCTSTLPLNPLKCPLLQVRIRMYFHHYYRKKSAFDEREILKNLSVFLRRELGLHLLHSSIFKIPVFQILVRAELSSPYLAPLIHSAFGMVKYKFGNELRHQ